jgi:phospholipid/cholesterol/gamma-HCH transport system substrate-binding protein
MTPITRTAVKLGVFMIVMALLTTFLFFIFGQFRTGSVNQYSAVLTDASRVKSGDSVRVAGIRVGTVDDVVLLADQTVKVAFDVDRTIGLTTGTKAMVRYLNLVGDRYLELVDGPGSTRQLPAGSQIPIDRTEPAVDLDMLLGGLWPVIRGLNPQDVNALTAALIEAFQGQDVTLDSLLDKTSSFSAAVADTSQTIQQLIDNLKTVLGALSNQGSQFSAAIDRLEKLISGLAADRDPIGTAVDSLSAGTQSLASLLGNVRSPLKGTVEQLNNLAPLIDNDKATLENQLRKLPETYRKTVRIGSYGSFLNYYICGVQIRVTDLQNRTAVFPTVNQTTGRCAEP